jgi:hypothetical protein
MIERGRDLFGEDSSERLTERDALGPETANFGEDNFLGFFDGNHFNDR